MKVMLIGDAGCSTGFARCTHAAADALVHAGHEVIVLGINYYGSPEVRGSYPYKIYPSFDPTDGGYDSAGATRTPILIDRFQPDAVVMLNDPWNIQGWIQHAREAEHKPLLVGWLAVDGCNQLAEPLNGLDHVIVWTGFAVNELRKGGYTGPISVVPLGVDHSVYFPRNREVARHRVFSDKVRAHIGENAFVVGVVGRNQLRKRIDLTLEYFSYFIRKYKADHAYLYLHVAPTGEDSADVMSLGRYHGLQGRMILGDMHPGVGQDEMYMSHLYSAFDVYTTTSQGEGWGLPALEAMACGTPCVLPDFAAFGPHGWIPPGESVACLIPCSNFALTAPMGTALHTVGAIPDREAWTWEMHNLYVDKQRAAMLAAAGVNLGHQFSWEHTGAGMVAVLESVSPRHVVTLKAPEPVEADPEPVEDKPIVHEPHPSATAISMGEIG